ncbi:DUF3160 domain-containing protein [Pelotomaculum terephthalicicum JT]|uniref:DUF3160 domain-containing protein n=1 Tax=Pelotomaculum TaxID=191373 RepID=UPI0009CFE303|nr:MULTISPECIES: DUF3160 domain-containing protein [Pelotomaculum]MCG9969885.1 DUF3160 domain-containing protein [Pelotomaculum terephthalicicum JT]OPX88437.1 MAG: hypothetical protein A4E54_01334 [Pelotomaculum sp. PtaB.Bin117]OPY59935.1 MAG: hypothetical protein A4E56_03005 [Pelotomaculum sp. PtaU1.Bin065]
MKRGSRQDCCRIIGHSHSKRGREYLPALILVLLLLAAASSGCSGTDRLEAASIDATFTGYEDLPVQVNPAVEPYAVKPDMGNITNKDMFELSPAAKNLLIKNGFVVVPNKYEKEFFSLYERNRYEPVPLFITTDSVLHNYHLFFDHLLRVVETEKLAPELKELNKSMLNQAQKQYKDLQGTIWENAARRNVGFFAVACKLVDPDEAIPSLVKNEVEKELDLIENHQGIAVSPLMNIGGNDELSGAFQEDYSQYVPRGHYDKTDSLKAYFKSMMWYGRLNFRFKSEDETRSALLITMALGKGENRRMWDDIYATTSFFVGKSDDISYAQIRETIDKIYGINADLQTVLSSPDKWNALLEAAGQLEPPSLNSIPVNAGTSQAERKEEIKGFRFMGQRFTIDASVFQRLVYREVGENSQGEQRMLPRGMDIPAAMGSAEAYAILQSMGETDYRNYPENMAEMKTYINSLSDETWTQNLYWNWLYALMPLIQEKPEGYPSFMRSQAWARKELNTYLGSWAELKHDTILYAKQVYAEAGGGGEQVDDRGYVEPNPYLYARLASLVKMTGDCLLERELLNERDKESLERMETLVTALKTISEKELANTPLTDEEYELIRSYGGQLEHFWIDALSDEGVDHRSAANDRPAALVGDVATDPNGQVLEEATGRVFNIYAVVPVDGKLRIAVGGVYSYYEFPWPLSDRLTDAKWHKMLDDGQAPPQPEWTKSFIAE